jgi:hypothetical protein
MRFNPYFTGGETHSTHTDSSSVSDSDPDSFQESTNAFKDIVSFGEGIANPESVAALAEVTPIAVPTPIASTPKSISYATPSDGSFGENTRSLSILISPTNEIPDHKTDKFYLPISVITEIGPTQGDPLAPGFQLLCQKAVEMNANGLCSLQWKILPDGSKIIFSAIPVHCSPR